MQKLEIVALLNFQDKLQTRNRSCISISSISITVLLIVYIYTKFSSKYETTVFFAVLSKMVSLNRHYFSYLHFKQKKTVNIFLIIKVILVMWICNIIKLG